MKASTFVFVDYDGVLQTPQLENFLPFEHLPEFERILFGFDTVEVVICSSHREGKTLEDLRQDFSPKFRHRVVGATPVSPLGRSSGGRHAEILAWLREHQLPTATWLAVDDEPELYRRPCPELLVIHPLIGLQGHYADELSDRIFTLVQSSRNQAFQREQWHADGYSG